MDSAATTQHFAANPGATFSRCAHQAVHAALRRSTWISLACTIDEIDVAARVFTDEQLREAWQARRRAAWPATFEEAMNDPNYRQIVRIEARIKANQAARRTSNKPVATPHRSPPGQLPLIPSTPPVLDHKRRAAGERDDD